MAFISLATWYFQWLQWPKTKNNGAMFGKAAATSVKFQSENLLTLCSVMKNMPKSESSVALSTQRVRVQVLCTAPSPFQKTSCCYIPRWVHFWRGWGQSNTRFFSSEFCTPPTQFPIKPLPSLLSQFIFSTQEWNAMQLYWKTYKHIYSFFKQIYRSSNCHEEQMIANLGKCQAKIPLTINKTH